MPRPTTFQQTDECSVGTDIQCRLGRDALLMAGIFIDVSVAMPQRRNVLDQKAVQLMTYVSILLL